MFLIFDYDFSMDIMFLKKLNFDVFFGLFRLVHTLTCLRLITLNIADKKCRHILATLVKELKGHFEKL